MDKFTIRNLELYHSNAQNAVTLLDVIDKTLSPMGSRLLKRWLALPLKEMVKIRNRHEVVAYFKDNQEILKTARTLIVNLTVGGLNDFSGNPTDLQVGSQAFLGPNGNYSVGFVYLQDQNSFTGQTVVSRFNTLRFNVGMATGNTAGPLGATAGALIDIYGGLRFEGTTGNLFQNGSTTTHYYTNVNFHPLSTLTFQDMTATGAGANRWGDSVGVNLDGSTIAAEATNNADNNTEVVGSVIFDRGFAYRSRVRE